MYAVGVTGLAAGAGENGLTGKGKQDVSEGKGGSGTEPSSKVLRENMVVSGQAESSYKNAAHHIVVGSSLKATEARSILEKSE